jgi:hypothetical protein
MSLRTTDTAPDFRAETTRGTIELHEVFPGGCRQPLPYIRLVRQPSDS